MVRPSSGRIRTRSCQPAYRDLIAGQFASMIVEFTELDHELVVGL